MADVTPLSNRGGVVEKFAPADRISLTVEAGQTVRGGRLVILTGNRTIREATAISLKVIGVALYDGAAGDVISVACEGVWMLTAAGAITYGDALVAGAAGTVSTVAAVDATNVGTLGTGMTGTRALIGRALESIADTATGPVRLGGAI